MLYVENKYIGLISNRLDQFKRQDNNKYNFRCPICGDSRRNKFKARGYLFEHKGTMFYKCHNCSVALNFGQLLEHVDSQLHNEYITEKFTSSPKGSPSSPSGPQDITKIVWPKFRTDSPLKKLKKVSQLKWDHPAKQYVTRRLIPNKYHHKLFYAPRFREFVNQIIPNKFEKSDKDEPRLIIPLIDKDTSLIGFQGRSFSQTGIRYITIICDESKPKLFGLDELNNSKMVYILEGPIDSMFVTNSVAMCGSDGNVPFDSITYIFDNEPRNSEIVKKVDKIIKSGYNVVIWPSTWSYKDINEAVMDGVSEDKIMQTIKHNTCSGLEAQLQFSNWSKI